MMKKFFLVVLLIIASCAEYQQEISLTPGPSDQRPATSEQPVDVWFIQDMNFIGKSIKTDKDKGNETNIRHFFEFLKKEGYNRVYFTPADADGIYYLISPTLNASGLTFGADFLGSIVKLSEEFEILVVVSLDIF